MSVISVEVRINGNLIAVINAVNRGDTGRYSKGGQPQCEYEWTSAQFPINLNGPPIGHTGSLRHFRDAGALALVRDLCDMHLYEEKKRK